MIEFYNKAKNGFEYCKKNIESDLSMEQFNACNVLCKNYANLCESYYYIINKKNKNNGKYFKGIVTEYINILSNMLESWEAQYNEVLQSQEEYNKNKKNIIDSLGIKYKYEDDRIKSINKQNPIKGFLKYSNIKSKKTRKKHSIEHE